MSTTFSSTDELVATAIERKRYTWDGESTAGMLERSIAITKLD